MMKSIGAEKLQGGEVLTSQNSTTKVAPPGYKQTKVGVIPENWGFTKLVDITFKITDGTHKTPKYTNSGVVFLSAKNIIGANLNFNDIKYISKEEHQDLIKRCFPEEKDILLTKSGSLGSAVVIPKFEFEFSIFESLALLKINKDICSPYYLNQYLNSDYSRRHFNAITTGLAVKHLHLVDLRKTRIPLPPLKEQQKIAQILTTWDDTISKQETLIKAKEELKKGLMQKLLSGEVQFDGFDREWNFTRLGDLLVYEQPTNYLVANKDYDNSYKTPVLTAGKTFILGYTKEENGIFKDELPVIIFDDFTTATKFVDFPFKAKSSAMKILKAKDETVNIKLVFEMMQMINYEADDHKRYWISEYQDIELKLPSQEEQQKIAQVLTLADKEIDLLKNALEALKEQKHGLMQRLLSGEVRAI